jgi:hypothetical protein
MIDDHDVRRLDERLRRHTFGSTSSTMSTSTRSPLTLVGPLEYRVVCSIKYSDPVDAIGIAFDRCGTFLAVAFPQRLFLYQQKELPGFPDREEWNLKATFTVPTPNSTIACMTWSAADVLVLGSNTGEVLLAITNSEVRGTQNAEPVRTLTYPRKQSSRGSELPTLRSSLLQWIHGCSTWPLSLANGR